MRRRTDHVVTLSVGSFIFFRSETQCGNDESPLKSTTSWMYSPLLVKPPTYRKTLELPTEIIYKGGARGRQTVRKALPCSALGLSIKGVLRRYLVGGHGTRRGRGRVTTRLTPSKHEQRRTDTLMRRVRWNWRLKNNDHVGTFQNRNATKNHQLTGLQKTQKARGKVHGHLLAEM